MEGSSKSKASGKHMTTEKGATIRVYESNYKKKQYINRRVITEISEKGLSEEIKRVRKQFNLPFKSTSPKMKKHQAHNHTHNNKQSHTNYIKKKSKIKSPNMKSKGHTETGPTIKRKNVGMKDKNHFQSQYPHSRKTKIEMKMRSPSRKGKELKLKKVNYLSKNPRIKTEGSFDSTSSCIFNNDVEVIGLIGQGTFGQVFKGRLKQTGEIIAIKRVLQDRKYKNREVEIVNMLNGDFVMKVLGTYLTMEANQQYLNIIMEHYDLDLFDFIKFYEHKPIPSLDIKLITYQIFRGLMYIHSKGICHRDIKPHNILLKDKHAVICDFGSAKIIKAGEPNLPYICSRCYRAPELIFGANHYTTMIDIWSVGCVILEMLNKVPLFIGESSVDHLIEVIKVMGTPTKSQVVDMNPQYDLNDYKFPKVKKKQWNKIFPKIDPLLLDLIEQIMLYSPKQRLNAAQALAHEYYDELREQKMYKAIVKATGVEYFFDFTPEELVGNQHLSSKLIPAWYKK